MHITAFLTLPLLPLALAHFQLLSPPARGYNEDTLANYPCGGQNTVGTNRTTFPLSGGPIQLNMEHDQAEVQVLLGLGDDVGGNFNITLLPIVLQQGIGKFCIGDVTIPSTLNLQAGQNATIQVVSNGDPSGGLYNCADVTLAADPPPGACMNGTGISVVKYTGPNTNANGTGGGASAAASGSAAGPTASSSTSGGMRGRGGLGGWGVLGGLVVVRGLLLV